MDAQFTLVEKEVEGTFVFPSEEVLKMEEAIKLLKNQLERAISLGTLGLQKLRICFEDVKKYDFRNYNLPSYNCRHCVEANFNYSNQ